MNEEKRKQLLLQRWASWLEAVACEFATAARHKDMPPTSMEWPYGWNLSPEKVPREFALMFEIAYRKGVQQGATMALHARENNHADEYERAVNDWRYTDITWALRSLPLDAPRFYKQSGKVEFEHRSRHWLPGGAGMPASNRPVKVGEATS